MTEDKKDIDYTEILKNLAELEIRMHGEFAKIDQKDEGIPRLMSIAKTNLETSMLYVDKACFIGWKTQTPLCHDE